MVARSPIVSPNPFYALSQNPCTPTVDDAKMLKILLKILDKEIQEEKMAKACELSQNS
jgi:hypothetical protein